MKHFILVFDHTTLEDQMALASFLGERQIGFWHKFPELWVAILNDDSIVLTDFRDQLRPIFKSSPNFFVFDITDTGWGAFIQTTWFDWFIKNMGAAPADGTQASQDKSKEINAT